MYNYVTQLLEWYISQIAAAVHNVLYTIRWYVLTTFVNFKWFYRFLKFHVFYILINLQYNLTCKLPEYCIWWLTVFNLLPECMKHTAWRWPFKDLEMFEWRIILIKWWLSNVRVHLSVLIWYSSKDQYQNVISSVSFLPTRSFFSPPTDSYNRMWICLMWWASASQSLMFKDTFRLRKITTEFHIIPHVNIVCPDGRYPN